jgi:hypothetical protein
MVSEKIIEKKEFYLLTNKTPHLLMKKIILFITLSFILLHSYAQKEHILVGLRGGFYFSRFEIKPKPVNKLDGDDAVYGGVQVQIPLVKRLFVMPEVLYALSSITYHNASFGTVIGSDDITKILIPVQLKYQIGHLGLYLGGQAEVLASAKYHSFGYGGSSINVIDSSYKKLDFSFITGFEYAFKYRFGIDARYHRSLGNMQASNGSTPATSYNGTVKMNAFEVGLFCRFGKKSAKPQKS